MKKFIYILIFTVGALNGANVSKLVWPPPPDEAKIEFVTSVMSSKDLEIKKSFFSKVIDFVLGEEEKPLVAPFGTHAQGDRVFVTDIVSKSLYVFDKKENETLTFEGVKKEKFLYPIDFTKDKKENIKISLF